MTTPTKVISQGPLGNHPCPACHKILAGFSAVSDEGHARPEPGTITLCAYCRTVLVFLDDMSFRVATDAEVASLPPLAKRMYRELPLLPSDRLPKKTQ